MTTLNISNELNSLLNIKTHNEIVEHGINWYYPVSYIIASSFKTDIHKTILANLSDYEIQNDENDINPINLGNDEEVEVEDGPKKKTEKEKRPENERNKEEEDDEKGYDLNIGDEEDGEDGGEEEEEGYIPKEFRKPVRVPLNPKSVKYMTEVAKLRQMENTVQSIKTLEHIVMQIAEQNDEFKNELLKTEYNSLIYINNEGNRDNGYLALNKQLYDSIKNKLLANKNLSQSERDELKFQLYYNTGNWYGRALMNVRKKLQTEEKNKKQDTEKIIKLKNFIKYILYQNNNNNNNNNNNELGEIIFNSLNKNKKDILNFDDVKEIVNDVYKYYIGQIASYIQYTKLRNLCEYLVYNPSKFSSINFEDFGFNNITSIDEVNEIYKSLTPLNINSYTTHKSLDEFIKKNMNIDYVSFDGFLKTVSSILNVVDSNEYTFAYPKSDFYPTKLDTLDIHNSVENMNIFIDTFSSFLKFNELLKSFDYDRNIIMNKYKSKVCKYWIRENVLGISKDSFNRIKKQAKSDDESLITHDEKTEMLLKDKEVKKRLKLIKKTVREQSNILNDVAKEKMDENFRDYKKLVKMMRRCENDKHMSIKVNSLYSKIIQIANSDEKIQEYIESMNEHISELEKNLEKNKKIFDDNFNRLNNILNKKSKVLIISENENVGLYPYTKFPVLQISYGNSNIFVKTIQSAFYQLNFFSEKSLYYKYKLSHPNFTTTISDKQKSIFGLENVYGTDDVLLGMVLKMYNAYKYYMSRLIVHPDFRSELINTKDMYLKYNIFDDIENNEAGYFLMKLRSDEYKLISKYVNKNKKLDFKPTFKKSKDYFKQIGELYLKQYMFALVNTDNWLKDNNRDVYDILGYDKITFIRNVVFKHSKSFNDDKISEYVNIGSLKKILKTFEYVFDETKLQTLQKIIYGKLFDLNQLMNNTNFENIDDFDAYWRSAVPDTYYQFSNVNDNTDDKLNMCISAILHLISIAQKLIPKENFEKEHLDYAISMLYMYSKKSNEVNDYVFNEDDEDGENNLNLVLINELSQMFYTSNSTILKSLNKLINKLKNDLKKDFKLKNNVMSIANGYKNIEPYKISKLSSVENEKKFVENIRNILKLPKDQIDGDEYRIYFRSLKDKPTVFTVKLITETSDDYEKPLKYKALTLIPRTDEQYASILESILNEDKKKGVNKGVRRTRQQIIADKIKQVEEQKVKKKISQLKIQADKRKFEKGRALVVKKVLKE